MAVVGMSMPKLHKDQIPAREGYTFLGYYNQKEGGTKYYDALGNSSALWSDTQRTATLYAQWEKQPAPDPDPDDPEPGEEIGWNYNESGGWYYVYDNEGHTYNDGWHWIEDAKFGNHWYYFKEDGFIATNQWIFTDAWYYVNSSGAMNVGTWNFINGAWYGFNWNSTMCTGWTYDSGYANWFYCNPTTGAMYTNCWSFINDAWYGFWVNGEQTEISLHKARISGPKRTRHLPSSSIRIGYRIEFGLW